MDINTNLEKAINSVHYLEDQVRELEKQNSKMSSLEASQGSNNNYDDDDGASSWLCCERSVDEWYEASQPEVNARVWENEVLIIIHCEKQKGIMNKILPQLEALNLCVISSSVLPFAKFTLHITIVAQIGEVFNSTVSGIVKTLRGAICK